ncbi:TonB-dependent receptor domain-containing protein [Klebsiella pneumoniae]|uniref:TonB-dependent receptor domain-containing protein n=1 Tax=Klebsiella pneumoniae TaxID=573 RepID=UPI003B6368AE
MLATGVAGAEVPGAIQLAGVGELRAALAKTLGRHDLSAGFNASTSKTQRPFSQSPIPSVYSEIMQPEADSRSYTLGGFVQDKINFDLDSHNFAIIPGVRVVHQSTKPENLSDLAANSSVLTESSVANLYGKNSDTQVLPSLTFQYDLTPRLMTYLQYQRGLQAPGVGIVVGVHRLHSAGDAVRHISPVMGFGMLVVDFRGDAVEVVVHRRPVILQAQAPAPGLAGLVGGADGAVAAGVPGIVVGVVGFMVIVEGAGQLVLIVRLPDPGGQKSIGVPVRRVGVDGAAVVFGFLAVTAAIDQNPAQELIAAGDGHPVVPAAIRRVVTAAVAEGAGLARAQVIIR